VVGLLREPPNSLGVSRGQNKVSSQTKYELRRFKDDMIMVGHQAVGMYLPTGLLAGLGQGFNKVLPINVVQKYLLAPVATPHDVIHCAGVLDAQFPRHG